jgi:phosphatidylglycerophosphatase A
MTFDIMKMITDLKNIYQIKKGERRKFLASNDFKSFDMQIATWFGFGLIIPASGTWGTIGGLIFGVILIFYTNSYIVLLTALALFFIGLGAVERIEKKSGLHDPSFIVIDEVVAILICIALTPKAFFYVSLILVFILFRFFDARKPWLIGFVDRKVKGAMGVMMDDVIAAAFAIVSLWLLLFIGVFFLILR